MNTKLEGSAGWTDRDGLAEGPVSRCIMRGSRELVLDATCDCCRYAVTLRRTGASQYAGGFERLTDRTTGNADCMLYRSEREVLLFGKWLEDGDYYHWWARLHEVKHFAGEVDAQDRNGNTAGSKSRVKPLVGAKCREEKKGTSPISSTKRVRR